MSINYHTFTQCMGSFICSAQTADSSLVHEHFPHWSCTINVYWVVCSIPTTDQEAWGLNIGWRFHPVAQVHFTSLHHWFPFLLGTCLCKSDIKRSPPSHPSDARGLQSTFTTLVNDMKLINCYNTGN